MVASDLQGLVARELVLRRAEKHRDRKEGAELLDYAQKMKIATDSPDAPLSPADDCERGLELFLKNGIVPFKWNLPVGRFLFLNEFDMFNI